MKSALLWCLLGIGCVKMKPNISLATISYQKLIEVDDERRGRSFYEKHKVMKVAADALGEERKVPVVRISGGNNKQGFPMKQASRHTAECTCYRVQAFSF